MDAFATRDLLSFLASVPDPRSRYGRQHPLSAILALVCCAILCGARGYAAIGQWAQDQDITLMHRLGFTRRPPKAGGIRKVLIALNAKAFEHALTQWVGTLLSRRITARPSLPEAYALDGKSARGSFDGLQKAVHLLSLLAHESGLTLAQMVVPNGGEEKTNEHKAALRLLEGLVLEGRLVTGDAMFCQRDFCQQVIDARGDYLVFVKDNQPTLLDDIKMAFAPSVEGAFPPRQQRIWDNAMDTVTTLDKGHGRRERRTLKATTALNEYLDWPGVAQVGQVESDVVKDGKTTHETRYFITSVSRAVAGAGQLLKWTRGHWSIENRSHYVRDVTMGEDASRVRKRSGPQVMAAFRNATIGLLRTMGVTNIAEALRRNASQVGQLFARLGIFKL
jgi:predicted transposase YbfD/YdcC